MEWLSLNWIAANWIPLAVALLLGFILGWLFTGIPAGRRAGEAEARAADAEARARKNQADLTQARTDLEAQRRSGTLANEDLGKAQGRLKELEAQVQSLAEEKASLSERVIELTAEVEAATAAAAEQEARALESPSPEEMAAGFANVARNPESPVATSPKDIALDEAFGRAATLQRELEERDAILAMRQAELETLKSELLTSNAARRELEARLVRAREDVAAELAVLASTMIKMKDDALARADARHAALQAEVDTLRASADRATQTAD
jgi:chromosome segregation protein